MSNLPHRVTDHRQWSGCPARKPPHSSILALKVFSTGCKHTKTRPLFHRVSTCRTHVFDAIFQYRILIDLVYREKTPSIVWLVCLSARGSPRRERPMSKPHWCSLSTQCPQTEHFLVACAMAKVLRVDLAADGLAVDAARTRNVESPLSPCKRL